MSIGAPRNQREWQQAVERKLAANKNGARIAIEHGTKAAQDVKDEVDSYKDLTPAAPIEITSQTAVYLNSSRRQRGNATFDFPDVVFATNGTPISVDSYEIFGQDQGLVPLLPFRLMNTSSLSSIYATDLNPGSTWKFRIRARSNSIIKPGLFSADQTVTITADTTPPPQTSAPVATAVSGGVKLEWDGLAAGGAAMPGDFDHVDIAFGMASNPTAIIDTFPGKSFTIIPKNGYNTVHYFRLRAVDTSGNVGPWSVQATAIPVPLVDVDIILSVLDGAVTTIKNVGSAALIDGAVTQSKLGLNAVAQDNLQNAIVSLAKLDTNANTKIQKGIDDAFTADGKAVLAQTKADKARLVADNAVAQAQNTVPDPTFDLGSERWDQQALSGSTSAFITDASAHRGTKVLEMTAPASASIVQVASDYTQPVVAGQIWEISAWVRVNGTLPTAGKIDLACITTSDTGVLAYPSQLAVPYTSLTNTMQKFTAYYTVPAGIVGLNYRMRLDAATTAGTKVQWSDVAMRDVTTAKSALDAATQAQIDATKAIGDASVALTAANGKNNIVNSTVDAGAGVPGKTVGDRWQKWTSLAAGGKLTATWRWNGSIWIQEVMDPTYLPLIDIGAGTFGTLNGMRMELGTLLAQHIVVGDFNNMIPGAQLQYGTTGWTTSNATIAAVTSALGLPGLQVTTTSATLEADAYAQFVDCTPGDMVRLSYTTEGVWSSGNAAIYAQKKNAAGVITSFNPGTTGANVPGDKSFVFQIPADAVQVRFRPYISASATIGSYAIFSKMWARRMNAGELTVDGTVTSNAIATNAVTARTLLVGDFQNFALGADFEDAAAVPFALNTNHALTTAQKKFGTTALRLGPATGVQSSSLNADMKVKEGEQYYLKFWAYIDAGFNGTASGSKLRVGDQTNTFIDAAAFNGITRSSWQLVEKTVTVPAGDTSLTIQLQSDHTAGTAYIDDIQIRRVSEASLIMNLGVEKLVATGASIGQAVIDKLWTDVVNSRKITTDMLVVTAGTNMVPDPLFQAPESRAKKFGNTTGWDTYVSGTGMQALRYGFLTPSWPSVGYLNLFDYDSTPAVADKTNWLPVIAGEKYEFSGRFYATDAGITTKMYVTFVKDDGTTSGWSSPTITPNLATPATERIPVWEFTIPANVIKMGARIEHRGTAGWVSFYNDGMYFRKKVDASLIVDGGIFAKHLTVTDEMWVKILNFKKLSGDQIDANLLNSDEAWIGTLRGGILVNDVVTTSILKADAITAKHTITGAKIQTTTTANRGLKLTSTGMQMWDAGGKLTVDMNAGTGYATLTGRIRTAPDGMPGVILLPSAESDDGVTMATWFTPDTSLVPGGITAGVYMGNPAVVTTPTQLSIRGHQYGGVRLFDEVEFATNNASLPRMMSNHGSGLQITSYNGTLYLAGSGGETRISSSLNTSINVGSGKQLNLQNAGVAYNRTNGSAANAIIFTDGNVFKVSSASKYKIDPMPMDLPDSLLDDVTVKSWIDVGMAERYAESFGHLYPYNEQEQREWDALSLERIPGAIAEDVEQAGGERFIVRDLDGEIDSLMYDRYALARTEILKRRLAEQAGEIAELRRIVEELVASLTA